MAPKQATLGYVKTQQTLGYDYLNLLASVVTDEYGRFVPAPPLPTDRRRVIAAVKP